MMAVGSVLGRSQDSGDVIRLLGLRAALLAVGFVASLGYTRVVVADFGLATYGLVALIVSLPLLIPFADFGLGASLVNAAARTSAERRSADLRSTLAKVERIYVLI